MERSRKQEIIEELRDVLSKSSSCIAIDFNKVDMETFTPFRKECALNNVRLVVVKNSLARIAVKDSDYEGITDFFNGMTALVCTLGEPVEGAKILKKFSKQNENVKVKGGVIDGQMLSVADVTVLADLPSKEELQAQLLATMLAVPQNFVRLLNAVPESFVRVLAAQRDKLEENA